MEDDAVLREVVKKALEGKGVLAQIRASLRAAVFTVVDEHERSSGVHVPNPAALDVKHDEGGRLLLQLVADFLEHWQLHQTLSILKLETDLATDDLPSREELLSIVGRYEATAGMGSGETKSPGGDESAPVMLQLLTGRREASQGDGNDPHPLAADSGGGGDGGGNGDGDYGAGVPRYPSLSTSFRSGELTQGPMTDLDGQEEKGNTSDDHDHENDHDNHDNDQEDEEGRWRRGVGEEGSVPPRVTLRKRRAGDRVGTTPTSLNSIRAGNGGGEEAALSSSDASPARGQPPLREEYDAGELEGSEPPGRLSSTASAGVGAGAVAADEGGDGGDGAGGYHFDGSMDQSSYHFSEDAVSVEGGAEGSHSPMGAIEVGGRGRGRGRGRVRGEVDTAAAAASAAAAGRIYGSPGAGGNDGDGDEEGETEGPGPEYRRNFSGEGEGEAEGWPDSGDQDGVGRTRRQTGGDADGDLDDDGAGGGGGGRAGGGALGDNPGVGLGVQQTSKAPIASGAAVDGGGDDDVDFDGDDWDEGQGGDDDDDDYYDDFHGDGDDDEEGEEEVEEALPTGGDLAGAEEEDSRLDLDLDLDQESSERSADLEWESRVGLSADSSVVVAAGLGGDDPEDQQGYEIEEARSL